MPADVLVMHFPQLELADEEIGKFLHGQPVRFEQKCEKMQRFRVYQQSSRRFVGLGEARGDGRLHPIRLLANQAQA